MCAWCFSLRIIWCIYSSIKCPLFILLGALSILTYLQDVPRLLTPTIPAAWCQCAAPPDPHPTTLYTQPPPPIRTSLPHPTILTLHHCLKERLWDTILPHRILTILHPNQVSVGEVIDERRKNNVEK